MDGSVRSPALDLAPRQTGDPSCCLQREASPTDPTPGCDGRYDGKSQRGASGIRRAGCWGPKEERRTIPTSVGTEESLRAALRFLAPAPKPVATGHGALNVV